MGISQAPRPARFAGRALLAALLLAAAACFAAPETSDELLQRADQIKLAHNDEFQTLLKLLDSQAERLTAPQHDYLDYFHAWQLGYLGEYPLALSAFQTLLARTQDPIVRARARISLIYDQVNAADYEGAYTNISALLDSLPQIKDRYAHYLVLITAAYLYSDAGQYDLAVNYIDQAVAYDSSERSACIAGDTRIEIMYKAGKLRTDDTRIYAALDACQRIDSPVDANVIRSYLAQAHLDQGHGADALSLLKAHEAEVLATHSSALNSDFRLALARGHLLTGDLAHAREYAQSAIDHANKQTYAKSVADAYEMLYEVAKRQGDDATALAYHEKYAAADKGYLNDTSARTLAFQMVNQQVLDKKRQIDALNDSNKMLQLKQQVDAKSAEAARLYILLLIAVLGSIALWAWKTKRSQLRFKKLARSDGLTGIFNRQYFLEAAIEALRYCGKSSRDACAILLDLDHFKLVNDAHGHAAGDLVLKRAVAACQAQLRSIDLFGRLGGEEFAILLPDCAEAAAAACAEEIRRAIAELAAGGGEIDVAVTASLGVATTATAGYVLRDLLDSADLALYAAKHAGRNRVVVYPPAVPDKVASASIATGA